ncbi:MAG: hypothetical protein K6G90_00040 [Clostridia bacterium]|nr:hypothetical protein [Clostridia bacterium]
MRTVGIAMTDRAICGIPEHTHGESCVSERILMCENEDHTHNEDCYETVWSCGLEEHSHSSECFPDQNADVESVETWEASLPELSGYPVSDLVRIAESQKGYTESVRNVEVLELDDGGYELHGYTRYGAFADDPYCDDWSAAFVSFCLHYSGLTQSNAPRSTECGAMQQLWDNAGLFSGPDAHDAQPGDLVFLDRDGNGAADSVGIVTYADAISVRAVEGNSNDKVEENSIPFSDGTILGYGVNAVSGTPGTVGETPDTVSETRGNESSDTSAYAWLKAEGKGEEKAGEKKSEEKSDVKSDVKSDAKSAGKTAGKAATKSSGGLRSVATGDVELDDYITDIAGSGTTKVEENLYQTTLELHFRIDTECIDSVTSGGYKFVFDLPDEVIIPEELTNGGPYYAYLLDNYPALDVAFTYDFIPTGDGHCRIEIVYDDDFVQQALDGGTEFINNVLRCRCFIRSSGDAGEDGLDVTFTDDQSLYIPPEEINENYDITAHKTGSYTADGKLHYEVTVSSVNGTPSDIDVTDTFTYSGSGTITPPTAIQVIKHNEDGTVEVSSIPAQGHLDYFGQNIYEISLNLPQLDDNEYYTLVYEYGVTGLPDVNAAVSAYNTLEATSSDNHETTSDFADYFIYNQQPKKVGKDGIPYGEYVQWNISVNDRGGDIAGKVIYDDSFADARNESINGTNGIFVQKGWGNATPGVDYEFVYNDGGDIVGIRFLPADASTPNNNTYHITYYTHPDVAYGETVMVHNDAEFDGDTTSYDVVVTGGDFEKTADGDQSIGGTLYSMNWTVNVVIPVGGIQSGTTFSDTLSPEGHYMTQAQYNALVTALQTAWGNTPVTVSPVYTGDVITGYTFTVCTAGNGYLMDDGLVDEIAWQYQTTGDMGGNTTQAFINEFTDGEKTLPVSIPSARMSKS